MPPFLVPLLVRKWGDEPTQKIIRLLRETSRMSDFRVGTRGFEPPTPCSRSRCANQAALRPDLYQLQMFGMYYPYPFTRLILYLPLGPKDLM